MLISILMAILVLIMMRMYYTQYAIVQGMGLAAKVAQAQEQVNQDVRTAIKLNSEAISIILEALKRVERTTEEAKRSASDM